MHEQIGLSSHTPDHLYHLRGQNHEKMVKFR